MDDWIINLGVSLLSAVLAPFIVTRLGGGTPQPAQQVSITGNYNRVAQTLDQSTTTVEIVYQQLPLRDATRGDLGTPGEASNVEPAGRVALLVGGACVLALTYLLVWPAVVWAFVGAAVGIAVATAVTASATSGTPGPRTIATALALISSAVLLLAAWWTLEGGPGSDVSFSRLEASVTQAFPEYADGVGGRWEVTTSRPFDVIKVLGVQGVVYVLTQVLALEGAAILVCLRAQELAGWMALHNLPANLGSEKLVDRASRFKSLHVGAVAMTLVIATLVAV